MGVPVVLPLNTPDIISTESDSFLCDTNLDEPGFLLSRSTWISFSLKDIPGGTPSITHPIFGP